MGKLEIISSSSSSSIQRDRRYRRFSLRYPVRVRFYCQDRISELDAESRNISIGGLLLETGLPIPQHSSVSFTLTLQGGRMVRPVELAGEGQVVRVQSNECGDGFSVAVQCHRPLIEIAQLA